MAVPDGDAEMGAVDYFIAGVSGSEDWTLSCGCQRVHSARCAHFVLLQFCLTNTSAVFGGAGPDGSALTDIWAISLSPNSSTTTWTQLRASQPSGVTGGSCMRTKTAGVMAAAMLTAAVFFAA